MWNTGYKGYTNRRRIMNGIPDGYVELNSPSGGLGPYFPPVLDLASCPTTSTTTTSSTTSSTSTSSTTTSSTSTSSTTTSSSTSTSTTTSSSTSSTTSSTTTTAPVFIWVADQTTCEQVTPFMLDLTITTLSSPQGLFYDDTLDRFYAVDLDDVGGNLWYFDPDTFTTAGSRTFVSGSAVPGQYIQSYDHSPTLRKIFLAGPGTSGVYVYNIATDALNLITTGTNGSFARVFTKFLNGTVYSANSFDDTLVLIDPVTETISSTISVLTIPGNTSNKYFNTSYNMYSVDGEIWVCAGSYRASNGSIARYNSTLTSFIGELTIPGVTIPATGGWAPGYWQVQFFDEEKNRFYLTDIGSKTITVIDTSVSGSPSIVEQIPIINLGTKDYAYVTWDINSVTGEMYANYTAVDGPADSSPQLKFYKTNRTTYQYEALYPNSTTNNLKIRLGTNELWSVNAGVPGWAGGVVWNTDGQAFKYVQ